MATDAKKNDSPKLEKPLDVYMLNLLDSSRYYGEKLWDKSGTTANFYILLLTAILAAIAGLFASDTKNIILQYSVVFIGSLILGSVGTLVFFLELSFFTLRRVEGLIQAVLHLYFRNINPLVYDKYGLPSLLTVLKRQQDPQYLPIFLQSTMVVILSISFFSSVMLALSNWFGYYLLKELNLWFPTLFGISILTQSFIIGSFFFIAELSIGLVRHFYIIKAYQKEVKMTLKRIAPDWEAK